MSEAEKTSYDELLRSPITVSVECIDGLGVSTGNKTFALTVTACTGGGNGTVQPCNLSCVQITQGCSAYINNNCTFIGT